MATLQNISHVSPGVSFYVIFLNGGDAEDTVSGVVCACPAANEEQATLGHHQVGMGTGSGQRLGRDPPVMGWGWREYKSVRTCYRN